MKTKQQSSIPKNGTPCLFTRKPPSYENARGEDATITSFVQDATFKRVNPIRIHAFTSLPAKNSMQTLHIYTNEVKLMDDLLTVIINIMGLHVNKSEIGLFIDGKFFVQGIILLRDEDIVEVKYLKTMPYVFSTVKRLMTIVIILFIIAKAIVLKAGFFKSQEIAISTSDL
jgi:hypothetical protein